MPLTAKECPARFKSITYLTTITKIQKMLLKNTLEALDKFIEKNGNTYCALTIELIQGEAGFIYGTKEYYEGIFKWAKKHGIYVWIDEVQSFARTHQLFAFQMFGLDEYVDVVTIGKVLQACWNFLH